jgi:ubiquinone/menaquinone biosynthesis C-methylase UbiE
MKINRGSLFGGVSSIIRPSGREAFLSQLSKGAVTLDVGCGNNSPERAKRVNPDLYYIGLDIGDYNQRGTSKVFADEYIVTPVEAFEQAIEQRAASIDAVISSHNLEHCADPDRVLRAMCDALKPNGSMYLSFPSEASVSFPKRRKNTLNFYDDSTHAKQPPVFSKVIEIMKNSGLHIEKAVPRHRPLIPAFFGAALEPVSYIVQRAMPFGTTWALYGFESVIWARRLP